MTKEKVCEYLPCRQAGCRKNPGAKPGNKLLWNGFIDKYTNQLACLSGRQVCFDCRINHYEAQAKTKYKDLYTEFPVMLIE